MHGHVTVRYLRAIFAISHGRLPTRSAFDNDECRVAAFQPINEAAHSWSYMINNYMKQWRGTEGAEGRVAPGRKNSLNENIL